MRLRTYFDDAKPEDNSSACAALRSEIQNLRKEQWRLEAERDELAQSVEDLKCWSANERRRSEQRLNALTEAAEKVLFEVDPLTNPVVDVLRAALNQEGES